ncbi:chalcone isomerase family protein [Roseibium sp.]|uniref:chalcone isomerase family protein n=1 Tax=Roseibium sp. TaxID=1936156 RepID=UPI003A9791A7
MMQSVKRVSSPSQTTAYPKHHKSWTRLRVILISLTLGAFAAITPASADIGSAGKKIVPSAQLVGSGTMTFLGFRVFKAELYAPDGSYDPQSPFALKLIYQRNFKGKDIVERSIDEIRSQGVTNQAKLNSWRQKMEAIFPNIQKGQSITGLRTGNGSALFYSGNRKLGEIRDREFTRYFFSIWLGSHTQDQRLRNKLIGKSS